MRPIPRFRDRGDAGHQLAEDLARYAGRSDVLVIALPRGGLPVGLEIARALDAPLDVMIVRKLGVPGHEELAMGAIASGGVRVENEEVVRSLRIPPAMMDRVAAAEGLELERRDRLYRGGRPWPRLNGRVVILVDDGIATGATIRAAIQALRAQEPARIVVAVPVAAASTCRELGREVDEVVCVSTPEPFHAVGAHYEDFPQLSDEEVREILSEAPRPEGADSSTL